MHHLLLCAVGVLFVIWQNIGNCSNTSLQDEDRDGKRHSSAESTSSVSSTSSSRYRTALSIGDTPCPRDF